MIKKFVSIICLFFSFLSVNAYGYVYNLSVSLIFKNEAPYLKEWIDYHRLMGVQHFYLFDNDSTDNFLEVLTPYIQAGVVELEKAVNQPDFNGTQVDCYNRTLIKSYGVSKWVAFIDSDEFIVTNQWDIHAFLGYFENFGGVALNWRVFGTSYVEEIPSNRLMIESLTQCTVPEHTMNHMVKSIVRPERAMCFHCPHHPIYVPGWYAVDTERQIVEGPASAPAKFGKVWINHYWTRDRKYFKKKKIPRRIEWYGGTKEDLLFIEDQLNATTDSTILYYVPLLRAATFNQ